MRFPRSMFHCQYGVVFLLLTLLVNCSTPSVSTVSPTVTQLVVTATLPSATVTHTPSPVPPTVTRSPTSTPAPPTVTPSRTLTADEKYAFLREMLQTNGSCELPCWWEVMPGETPWQDVKDRFGLYYGNGISQPDGTMYYDALTFDVPHPDRLFDYRVSIAFVERDGAVQSIKVRSSVFTGARSEHFAQDWQCCSLDQVLTRYGEPSQVMLQLTPPMDMGSPAGYSLEVFYDQLGIAIRYLGLATYDGTTVQACPVFEQVIEIDLWLQSPEDESSLVEHVIAPDVMAYFRSLEEATDMSLETFYDTFSTSNSQVCLEGPPTLP